MTTPIQLTPTTCRVDLPCGDEVEIGDKDSIDFKPKAKVKRWGGECSLTIELPTNEKVLPVIEGEKVKWKGKDTDIEMFSKEADDGNEQGSFEYDIVLREKPKSNIQTLNFNSDNLKFYYQPPLTQEFKAGWSEEFQCEIEVNETTVTNKATGDVLVHRPKKVVGSYVAYHATKTNMHPSQVEADKYKTGQAFFWYRPLIWDSSVPRKECWGELYIDKVNGIRTVTIPQDFLDSAVYPATIDDEFGYHTKGSTLNYINSYMYGSLFPSTADGTPTAMGIYIENTTSAKNIGLAIYEADFDLMDYVKPVAIASTYDDWKEASLVGGTSSIVNGNSYWLVVSRSDIDHATIWTRYTASSIPRAYDVLAYADFPEDPWTPTESGTRTFSIYCTYTPSGGEETVVTPGVIAQSLTEYISILKEQLTPTTLSLSDTQFVPVLKEQVTPSLLALSDTQYVPILKEQLTPTTLVLTDTQYIPVLKHDIISGLTSLASTKYIPILMEKLTPITLALSDTEYTPILKEQITPSTLTLATAKYTPVLNLQVTPSLLALLDTEYTPVLELFVVPPVKALALTEYTPVLGFKYIIPKLDLTLTGFIPLLPGLGAFYKYFGLFQKWQPSTWQTAPLKLNLGSWRIGRHISRWDGS